MASWLQSPQGINDIPQFLRASSVMGLRRLMFQNNKKHKAFIKYFDIQFVEKESRWYAWYFVSLDFNEMESVMREEEVISGTS